MPTVGERSEEGTKNENVDDAIDRSARPTQNPANVSIVRRNVGTQNTPWNGEAQSNERQDTEYPKEYCDPRDFAVGVLTTVQGIAGFGRRLTRV